MTKTTKSQALVTVRNTLDNQLTKIIDENEAALPEGFNKTRFLQNSLVVLRDTDDIESMDAVSIARCMIKGAFLGLDFFNRECYAIKYGNSLNFQTDYKGEIKLAKRFAIRPVREVYAYSVRQGDTFNFAIVDGKQEYEFKPQSFSNEPVIGYFSVAEFEDGGSLVEVMTKAEVEEIRNNFSKMKNSMAWVKSFDEMGKKVVIRRLCKKLQLQFEKVEQALAWESGSESEVKPEAEKEPTNSKLDAIFEDGEIVDGEIVEQ